MTDAAFIGEVILVLGFHAVVPLYPQALLRVDDPDALRAACHRAAMMAQPAVYDRAVGGWRRDHAGTAAAFFRDTLGTMPAQDQEAFRGWIAQDYDGTSAGANPKAIWCAAADWCARTRPDLGLDPDATAAALAFCDRFHGAKWDPAYAEAELVATEAPYDLHDIALVERHNYHLSSEDETVPMINGISLTIGTMRQWHLLLDAHLATEARFRPALRQVPAMWVRQMATATQLRAAPADYDLEKLTLERLIA